MALSNYKEHLRLYKELINTEKMNAAKRLAMQYEIARKEKAILEIQFLTELKDKELTTAHYKAARRKQEVKALQQTVTYNNKLKKVYAVAFIGFPATVFLLYAYRQRSKALAQKQKLHTLELEKVKQTHRIAMLWTMLDGQEKERTHLARDLHDGLGGLLSGVKIGLSGVTLLMNVPAQQTIVADTLNHLDNAADELRRIAKSMMPEVLLLNGLGEAIKEYCNGLQKSGIPVNCQVYLYKNDIEHSRQVTLYRIVQKLVNNAVKRPVAKQILVQLQQSRNRLFLTVEDNRQGFGTSLINDLKSAGLSKIQARVEIHNGQIGIEVSRETGTTFTFECLTK